MAAPEAPKSSMPSSGTTTNPLTSATTIKSELPRNLPPGLQNLMKNLQTLDKSTSWSDVKTILDTNFTEDAFWDAHMLKISGRDKVRPVWTVLTMLAKVFSDPQVVRIVAIGKTITQVEVETQLRYHFNRSLVLPMTYLIPDALVNCTCTILLRGDKVCGIKTNYHNLPSLPWFMRMPLGWGVGLTASLAEPLALMLYKWYETSKEAAANTARPVMESDAVRTVAEKVSDLTEPIKEKVISPVTEKVGMAANKVQEIMT